MKVFGADPNFNQNKIEELKKRDRSAQAKASGSKGSSAGKSSETVDVSGAARDTAKVNDTVRVTQDIRAEKVEAIKSQVQRGEYHVSGDKIAGKIIEDIIKQGGQ